MDFTRVIRSSRSSCAKMENSEAFCRDGKSVLRSLDSLEDTESFPIFCCDAEVGFVCIWDLLDIMLGLLFKFWWDCD